MFDLKIWKQKANEQLKKWMDNWRGLKQNGTAALYSFICASALFPLIEASQRGDVAAFVALGQITAGIGANLVANLIQKWKDKKDLTINHLADEIEAEIKASDDLRNAVDDLMEKIEIMDQALKQVPQKEKEDFVDKLADELKELGNFERFKTIIQGSAVIADSPGAKIGMPGAVVADDIRNAIIVTGKAEFHAESPAQKDREKSPSLHLRDAYLHKLLSKVRKIPLSGIDPRAVTDEEAAKLELSAVYTALMTEATEKDQNFAERAFSQEGKEIKRLSAIELLNREKKLVLMGEPGSGKTTFVNFVALCMIGELLSLKEVNLKVLTAPIIEDENKKKQKPQPWDHGALLPVVIVLRDFAASKFFPETEPATADHLWRFIVHDLGERLARFEPQLEKHLAKKGGLIMFDGLDEVPEAGEKREQLKNAINDFANVFHNCRFLVTSRPYAYQKPIWKLEDFAEGKISDFTDSQINFFIDKWYNYSAKLNVCNEQTAQGRAELLKRAIQNNPRLKELAVRPLLLTLMASLHAWRGGDLPEKREQLYADAVDLLLYSWERPKIDFDYQGKQVLQPSLAEWLKVDRESMQRFLNRLAYEAHLKQKDISGTADIPQSKIVDGLMSLSQNPAVNPVKIIEYISQRAGLLLPRGDKVYAFPHRTFQEYLAACHLTDQDFPDNLVKLVLQQPEKWREVTLLAGAKSGKGGKAYIWPLIEALTSQPLTDEIKNEQGIAALLAGQLLLENDLLDNIADRNVPKLDRVREWLIKIVQTGALNPLDRVECGNILATLGDPRFDPEAFYLPREPLLGLVKIPPGEFFMGTSEKDIPDLMEKFGGEEEWYKDEVPLHKVKLPLFYISRYPVTVAQFRYFIENSDRKHSVEKSPKGIDTHPVVWVTWYDAIAYCQWLTDKLKKWEQTPPELAVLLREKNWRFTLPSEAEWEKAARGGNDKRIYPWGDEITPAHANYSDTGINATSPVGCFPAGASPYGLLDMSGNVWEWTRSLWGESWDKPYYKYPYDPKDGRENVKAKSNILRVLRGGSFNDRGWDVRCAGRNGSSPSDRDGLIGFRVLLSPL